MDIQEIEEFIICPCCHEENFVTVNRGFNIVTCPCGEYFFIVYLDDTGKSWTREPWVLGTGSTDG